MNFKPDEHRVARHDLAGDGSTPVSLVVVDHQSGDGLFDDADGSGNELLALVGREWVPLLKKTTSSLHWRMR